MSSAEKPNSERPSPLLLAADPRDIPTDAASTNIGELSEPSGPHPFRVIWPEPSAPVPKPDDTNGNTELHLRKRLGRYEIVEEIAKGGMGVIYKAHDTQLNRDVALKMLRTGPLSRPEELRRFKREAQAQARIKHRHILEVFDVGECDGMQYFTMPLVPGGSLNKRRKDFVGQPHKVVPLVEKVARAVEHAHSKGILHRDIKPGNILLDENDEPLVGDFGLAKMEDSSVLLTRSDQVIGTPAYMAPEQANSSPTNRVTARTDVWGLGVLLYELLTGELPFKGPTSSVVIQEILNKRPTAPRRLKGDLDPVLERIVLRCLEKHPPWRYPSAEALADDLAKWQKGEKVESVRVPLGQLVKRAIHRISIQKVVMAALVLSLVGLVCWLALGPKEHAPFQGPPAAPTVVNKADPWAELSKQLDAGQAVPIIPELGGPIAVGKIEGGYVQEVRSLGEQQRAYYLLTEGATRVPLIPAGYLPPRYRIKLKFKHDTPAHGIVGIYALFHRHELSRSREAEVYLTLTVGNHGNLDQRYADPELESVCWLFGHFDPKKGWPESETPLSWENSNPFSREKHNVPHSGTWREMALEVRPESIRVFLDGKFLYQVSHGELFPEGDGDIDIKIPFSKTEAPNVFSPAGGMGLFVHSAGMSVRYMVVEPLPK